MISKVFKLKQTAYQHTPKGRGRTWQPSTFIPDLPETVEISSVADIEQIMDKYKEPLIFIKDTKTGEIVVEVYNWYRE